jgi:hypothetical protein
MRKGYKEVTDPREAPGARHPLEKKVVQYRRTSQGSSSRQ